MPEKTPVAVLDDDPDFRTYIEDLLVDEGAYTVETFASPDQLLAACEQRLPAIVLLDMKMGEIRGDTVVEQLLARWPGLCVIIVTGYPSLEDMRNTFRMKVFDYLPKPFTLAQLRQTLKSAVEAFGLGKTPRQLLRERLGQRIKLMRAERDWSLKELAQSTGLSVSQISSIERGAHLPSVESLVAIAGALGQRASGWLSAAGF